MCILKVEVFSVIFFPLPAFTSFLHSCFCFASTPSVFLPSPPREVTRRFMLVLQRDLRPCQKIKKPNVKFYWVFMGCCCSRTEEGEKWLRGWLVFPARVLEFGWPALLKVVEINTLNWAQWPEDVVPNVKVGEQYEVSLETRAPTWTLMNPDCRAQVEPKLNRVGEEQITQGPSQWNSSISGQIVHFPSK